MGNSVPQDNGLLAFFALVAIIIYLLPTIIAFARSHEYRWIIATINVLLGLTAIGWIASFIWAIWPSEKSLADPVIGNVTGTGKRNVGDTLGAAQYGISRGYTQEAGIIENVRQSVDESPNTSKIMVELERLGSLRQSGVISEEEFQALKATIIKPMAPITTGPINQQNSLPLAALSQANAAAHSEDIEELLSQGRFAEFHLLKAKNAVQEGKLKEAEENLEACLAHDPSNKAALAELNQLRR